MTSVTQLIDYINHIYEKKEHALKWEVVGKEDDDLRILISFKRNRKLNQNKLHRLKKVMSMDSVDKRPLCNPKKPDKSELSFMLQEKLQELENRVKRDSLDEIRMADVLKNLNVKNGAESGSESNKTSPKAKRRNPFRRLNKGEKLKAKKGKLKLSLSVENLTLESDIKRQNDLFSILERKSSDDSKNTQLNDNKENQNIFENNSSNLRESESPDKKENTATRTSIYDNVKIVVTTATDDKKESIETSNDDKSIENKSSIQDKLLDTSASSDNTKEIETPNEGTSFPNYNVTHKASIKISSTKIRERIIEDGYKDNSFDKTPEEENNEVKILPQSSKKEILKESLKENFENEKEDQQKLEENKEKVKEEKKDEEKILSVSEIIGKTGWENCQDCKFSGFCDYTKHKREYLQILKADAEYNQFDYEDCPCNVCTLGADHNGCVYREIVRLRNCYKLFDRRNLCICSVCVPFKYRTMCLRQELRILRNKGQDEYYRLTHDGNDGRKLHRAFDDSDSDSDEPIP